jgi:putative DNA methylase
MDRLLGISRTAPLHLYRPEIAKMVVETLWHHAQHLEYYHLHSYVVMPNHVHLLITPRAPVSKLMQSLKRFTAQSGSRSGRTRAMIDWSATKGSFGESFDTSRRTP